MSDENGCANCGHPAERHDGCYSERCSVCGCDEFKRVPTVKDWFRKGCILDRGIWWDHVGGEYQFIVESTGQIVMRGNRYNLDVPQVVIDDILTASKRIAEAHARRPHNAT